MEVVRVPGALHGAVRVHGEEVVRAGEQLHPVAEDRVALAHPRRRTEVPPGAGGRGCARGRPGDRGAFRGVGGLRPGMRNESMFVCGCEYLDT